MPLQCTLTSHLTTRTTHRTGHLLHPIKAALFALGALHCTQALPSFTTTPSQKQPSQNPSTVTMQLADNRLNKNSMVLALRKYSAAVNHMEHTVLLPTLLRDVPSDEIWDGEEEASQDLYQNYLTLKAIKITVESGLIPLDDQRSAKSRGATSSLSLTSGSLVEADQEALFHFHLSGLFSVLGHLTKKSQSLTEKYKEIIGVAY